ncbi:DMT family transporter [Pseudoflavonifractor sp.]|jgi:drug/metabolite transporter (DMT)-like permease|uniref:DMT family transporter n=1 Tax=Pseudoflavonifractor sp. TaxID=1980281 RepID=UPI003D915805
MTKLTASPKAVLFLGVLGAAFSSFFVRWSQAPSLFTATCRLGWTVVLLLPALLLRYRDELKQLKGRDLLSCAASGALLALHFASWFESLRWTSVASSTVLVSTEVIFCALGFALFLKGKIPRLGVAAIALAFLGSVVLALSDGGGVSGRSALYGDLLSLAGAVFVALYTLIGRVERGHMSTTVYTFFTYLSSFLTLLLLDLITGTPVVGYPPREWVIGLLLAVVCTLLGHSLFSWSLKYLSPSYVSAAKLCEPVFATVLAVPLFGEMPGLVQAAGGVLVLAGVLLYTRAE